MSADQNTIIETFVSVAVILPKLKIDMETFLRNASNHLQENFQDYELVLIDPSSNDAYESIMNALLKELPSIRYIKLASSVSDEVASAAAFENTIGDFIILMNPLTDPIEMIRSSVLKSLAGTDILIGVADQNPSLGYRILRSFIRYVFSKVLDYRLPKNATDFRCISRRALNTIMKSGRFYHQVSIRLIHTEYKMESFPYEMNKTAVPQTKTLVEGIKKAIHFLVFNSTKPLRWMSMMGILSSCIAFFFGLYSLLIRFFIDHVVEGWTSMVLFMSILFGLLFIILAFFGEYLSRLLDETHKRQEYDIIFERNSSVMLKEQRYNILQESLSRQNNAVQTGRKQ